MSDEQYNVTILLANTKLLRDEISKEKAFSMKKKGLFSKKVPFLEYGSPSWSNFELLTVIQEGQQTTLSTRIGHVRKDHGLF
jgi:hypothetical protein